MGLVTVFWRLMRTGPGETVAQTAGETRFVVDCQSEAGGLPLLATIVKGTHDWIGY